MKIWKMYNNFLEWAWSPELLIGIFAFGAAKAFREIIKEETY